MVGANIGRFLVLLDGAVVLPQRFQHIGIHPVGIHQVPGPVPLPGRHISQPAPFLLVRQDFGIISQRQCILGVELEGPGASRSASTNSSLRLLAGNQWVVGVPVQHKCPDCPHRAVIRSQLDRTIGGASALLPGA